MKNLKTLSSDKIIEELLDMRFRADDLFFSEKTDEEMDEYCKIERHILQYLLELKHKISFEKMVDELIESTSKSKEDDLIKLSPNEILDEIMKMQIRADHLLRNNGKNIEENLKLGNKILKYLKLLKVKLSTLPASNKLKKMSSKQIVNKLIAGKIRKDFLQENPGDSDIDFEEERAIDSKFIPYLITLEQKIKTF